MTKYSEGVRVLTKAGKRPGTVCAVNFNKTGQRGRPATILSVEHDDGNVAEYRTADLRILA